MSSDPQDDLRPAEYAHREALARRDLWRRTPSLRRLLDQGRPPTPCHPAPPEPWDYPDAPP